jgi:hypothetical protein
MSPIARIRVGARAALRRRYGYAALRVLRRAVRAARAAHEAAQAGDAPYGVRREQIAEAYAAALKRLRKRWPRLDFGDDRANP